MTGHRVKVQVVQRSAGDQYTITLPVALARFWNLKKGDELTLSEEPRTKRVILTQVKT